MDESRTGIFERQGKRRVLKMLDPKRPSRAEVEEHEETNLPYRIWC